MRLYPDPILLATASPVESFDRALKSLIGDMVDAMYASRGIGLAAPQIGHGLRVIVVDAHTPHGLLALVNPVIERAAGRRVGTEGCLSIPGVLLDVERPARVVVVASDPSGRPVRLDATGLLAVALHHEIDHLDGRVMFDRVPEPVRAAAIARYTTRVER